MNEENEYTLTVRMGEVAVHVQMGEVVYRLSPIQGGDRGFTSTEKHMLSGMLLAALAIVEASTDA
jgi:hypothetical protein